MRTSSVKKLVAFSLALLFIPISPTWADSIIPDPVLAKAIRTELRLPSGKELTSSDLKKLESLYPAESKEKITRLQGIENAVNMEDLFLTNHSIKDITPIAKLKKLTFLALDGNQITDLTPLSGLNALENLVIVENKVSNLKPLQNLSNLTSLLASNNLVTDLNPIKDMKLEWIFLDNNKIQDLTPLRNHPTIEHLYLGGNLIADIRVLETIPNLEEVSLINNPLNEQSLKVIGNLEKKGVAVEYDSTKQADSADKPIQVLLDTESVTFEVPPFMKNGSVMVPFRTLFEQLGLKVTWNKDKQTIIGEKEGTTIKMQVGLPNAEVNGKTISLAVAPTIVSGNTFVPLRFIAESLNAKVDWEAGRKLAVIQSKQQILSSDRSVEVTAYGKWSVIEDASKNAKLAIQSYNKSTLVVNEIPKTNLTSNTNLDAFYQSIKTEMIADPNIEIVEEVQETFLGYPAKSLAFYKMENGWESYICVSMLFEANGHFYQVTISANEDLSEDEINTLDEMVTSLKLNP